MTDHVRPIILYENLLRNGTVVATGTNGAYAYDGLTWSTWVTTASGGELQLTLSTAASADCFAFHGHTMAETAVAGSIKLQYHDGGGYVDIAETVITPTDNKTTLVTFPAKSATLWKVVVSSSTAASIAQVAFGTRLDLEQNVWVGFTPTSQAGDVTVLPSTSDGGEILGRSVIRRGLGGTIQLRQLTRDWIRDSFDPFRTSAETYAWFLKWSPFYWPNDAAFCQTTSNPQPTNQTPLRMSVDIPFRGKNT